MPDIEETPIGMTASLIRFAKSPSSTWAEHTRNTSEENTNERILE